jgi:uncharacterized protein
VSYLYGKGVTQDDAEALKWFRNAGDQSSAVAQFDVGLMYAEGKGVRQDDAEALKSFRKGAEKGSAAAQRDLGLLYYHGRGVPQDLEQAYAWLFVANAQGLPEAAGDLDLAKKSLTPPALGRARKLSARHLSDYGQSNTTFR